MQQVFTFLIKQTIKKSDSREENEQQNFFQILEVDIIEAIIRYQGEKWGLIVLSKEHIFQKKLRITQDSLKITFSAHIDIFH